MDESLAGSFSGVWCAVLLSCMLKVALECTCSFGDQEFKRTGSPARALKDLNVEFVSSSYTD